MDHPVDLLPAPRVVRCFFARQFQPHIPAMELAWDLDALEKTWLLPGRLTIQGPAPATFGVIFERQGPDDYDVKLIWNDLGISWCGLSRVEILASSLSSVLQALGTDIASVCDQPIHGHSHTLARRASEGFSPSSRRPSLARRANGASSICAGH